MKTARQLQDMMRDHLRLGRDCIYLCASRDHCKYTCRLMLAIYEPIETSVNMGFIKFKYARVIFHSITNPPHTLHGKKGFIIRDHNAFINVQHREHFPQYMEIIKHQNQRIIENANN